MPKTVTEPAKKLPGILGIHAFTAAIFHGKYIIGRADLCVRGYTPMDLGIFRTFEEASNAADELNKKLNLSVEDACKIVATTMHRVSDAQKIVNRLNEFIPGRSGGQVDMDGIEDWLMNEDDGAEQIREAATEE